MRTRQCLVPTSVRYVANTVYNHANPGDYSDVMPKTAPIFPEILPIPSAPNGNRLITHGHLPHHLSPERVNHSFGSLALFVYFYEVCRTKGTRFWRHPETGFLILALCLSSKNSARNPVSYFALKVMPEIRFLISEVCGESALDKSRKIADNSY
jgi:hypothetical protein